MKKWKILILIVICLGFAVGGYMHFNNRLSFGSSEIFTWLFGGEGGVYTDEAQWINFTPPTPADGTITSLTLHTINITMELQSGYGLMNYTFVWNNGTDQTNLSYYDEDLVLMMNFENLSSLEESDTKIVDISRYGNNGTMGNGNEFINLSGGRYGGAVQFDGTGDYVSIGDMGGFTISTTGFTYYAWAYFKALPPEEAGNQMYLAGKGNADNYEWGISVNGYDHDYGKMVMNHWPLDGSTASRRASSTSMATGQWYHIAFTLADSTGTTVPNVYINGVLDNGNLLSSEFSGGDGTSPVWFGIRPDNIGYNFNGLIDEVRIYNRSLTAQEITELYKSNLQKFNNSHWEFVSNQSNLQLVNYSYSAGACDLDGKCNSTETRWLNISAPSISLSMVYPTGNVNVKQNVTFQVSVDVACSVMDCNDINVTLAFNETIPVSSIAGTTPFHTDNLYELNPMTINLSKDESFIVTWYVNATGDIGNNYTFFAYANQTSNMDISSITPTWNVTIESEEVTILSGYDGDFNSCSITDLWGYFLVLNVSIPDAENNNYTIDFIHSYSLNDTYTSDINTQTGEGFTLECITSLFLDDDWLRYSDIFGWEISSNGYNYSDAICGRGVLLKFPYEGNRYYWNQTGYNSTDYNETFYNSTINITDQVYDGHWKTYSEALVYRPEGNYTVHINESCFGNGNNSIYLYANDSSLYCMIEPVESCCENGMNMTYAIELATFPDNNWTEIDMHWRGGVIERKQHGDYVEDDIGVIWKYRTPGTVYYWYLNTSNNYTSQLYNTQDSYNEPVFIQDGNRVSACGGAGGINKISVLADSYLYSYYVTNNYGTSTILNYLNASYLQFPIIKFDISSIPTSSTINDAKFCTNLSSQGLDPVPPEVTRNIVYLVNDSYKWEELTVNYNGRPNGTSLLNSSSVIFNSTPYPPVNKYFCFNVTNQTQEAKTRGWTNMTLYFKSQTVSGGPTNSDFTSMRSKESSSPPFLNVSYTEIPSPSKGLIPNDSGNPFYVDTSTYGGNPRDAYLDNNYTLISWTVYANGTEGTNYTFFAYANSTSISLYAQSGNVEVNITPQAAGDTCSCPASGDWIIDNGDICSLTTTCDLTTNKFYAINGFLRVNENGYLKSSGCYINQGSGLYTDSLGRTYCGG